MPWQAKALWLMDLQKISRNWPLAEPVNNQGDATDEKQKKQQRKHEGNGSENRNDLCDVD